MLLLGYILVTCQKNNIVTLHVTFMLYRRNKTCLMGKDWDIKWLKCWPMRDDTETRRQTGKMKIGNLTVGVHNTSEMSGNKFGQ